MMRMHVWMTVWRWWWWRQLLRLWRWPRAHLGVVHLVLGDDTARWDWRIMMIFNVMRQCRFVHETLIITLFSLINRKKETNLATQTAEMLRLHLIIIIVHRYMLGA